MPSQLWETTMDPERRLLKQLMVEDAAEANVSVLFYYGHPGKMQKWRSWSFPNISG